MPAADRPSAVGHRRRRARRRDRAVADAVDAGRHDAPGAPDGGRRPGPRRARHPSAGDPLSPPQSASAPATSRSTTRTSLLVAELTRTATAPTTRLARGRVTLIGETRERPPTRSVADAEAAAADDRRLHAGRPGRRRHHPGADRRRGHRRHRGDHVRRHVRRPARVPGPGRHHRSGSATRGRSAARSSAGSWPPPATPARPDDRARPRDDRPRLPAPTPHRPRRRDRPRPPASPSPSACWSSSCLASIAVGAKSIPFGTVLDALFHFDPTNNDHLIVRSLRVPAHGRRAARRRRPRRRPARSCRASPATRWPTRASSASTPAPRCSSSSASTASASTSLLGYVWFAFAGAAARLRSSCTRSARSGREGATPVKLALAGAAAHRPARLDHDGHPAARRRHARPVPLLGRRLARRARRRRSPPTSPRSSSSASCWRIAAGADAQRAGARRRRRPRRSASGSALSRLLGAVVHRAAVRRGDGGGRTDRVRRPHRAPRRPGDHRARLPLDPAVLDGAGADPAARRRHHRPRHRPPGRGAGRHRHRDHRRARSSSPSSAAGSWPSCDRRSPSRRGRPSAERGRHAARRPRTTIGRSRRPRRRPLVVAFCVSISVGDFPIPLRDVVPGHLRRRRRRRRVHRAHAAPAAGAHRRARRRRLRHLRRDLPEPRPQPAGQPRHHRHRRRAPARRPCSASSCSHVVGRADRRSAPSSARCVAAVAIYLLAWKRRRVAVPARARRHRHRRDARAASRSTC